MRVDHVAAWVLSLPAAAVASSEADPSAAPSLRDSFECLPSQARIGPRFFPAPNEGFGSACDNWKTKSVASRLPLGEDDLLLSAVISHDPSTCDGFGVAFAGAAHSLSLVDGNLKNSQTVQLLARGPSDETRRLELEVVLGCEQTTNTDIPGQPLLTRAKVTGWIRSIDGPAITSSTGYQQFQIHSDHIGGLEVWTLPTDSPPLHLEPSPNDELVNVILPNLRDDVLDALTGEEKGGDGLRFDPSSDPSISGTIGENIFRLEQGQAELERLREKLDRQRQVVDKLTGGRYSLEHEPIKQCKTWSCIVSKLLHRGKTCVHELILRLILLLKPEEGRAEMCARMASTSAATQAKFFMSPSASKACSKVPRPNTKGYTILSDSSDDYDSSDDSDDDSITSPAATASTTSTPLSNSSIHYASLSEAPTRQSYITTHKIHAALAFVLSLLCLSCLTICLHRRCADPRRKVDRAAWREERRTRRAFARAARRHAWRDWWTRTFGLGCCSCCGGRKDKRITEYEEKRALILEQEGRLEGVMQDEIRYLTHGSEEEGRVPLPPASRRSMYEPSERRRRRHRAGTRTSESSSNEESLPSYRSRDASGSRERPPSYRTRASSVGHPGPPRSQEAVDELAARVASSFPYIRHHERIDWAASDDGTPDSSVVNVSPRLSCETLRSELSVL